MCSNRQTNTISTRIYMQSYIAFILLDLNWFGSNWLAFFIDIVYFISRFSHLFFFSRSHLFIYCGMIFARAWIKTKKMRKTLWKLEKKLNQFSFEKLFENTKKIVWEMQNRTQTDNTIASYTNETEKQHVFVYIYTQRERERKREVIHHKTCELRNDWMET